MCNLSRKPGSIHREIRVYVLVNEFYVLLSLSILSVMCQVHWFALRVRVTGDTVGEAATSQERRSKDCILGLFWMGFACSVHMGFLCFLPQSQKHTLGSISGVVYAILGQTAYTH